MATESGTAIKTRPLIEQLPPHRPLGEFYGATDDRAPFVRRLFDQSAPYYDKLSAALSLGSDRPYRKMVLRDAGLKPGMKLLDVATGTGLVARAALDLGLGADDIVGLDPSAGMLEQNRRNHPIRLIQASGEHLPFADNIFDFVTMGYALRHVEDLGRLFTEFYRVLKPAGRVVILELSRPQSKLGCAFMSVYLGKLLPFVTRLVTRRAEPARLMEYYWATIAECVPPPTICRALATAGFVQVERQTRGSILNDYFGCKASL